MFFFDGLVEVIPVNGVRGDIILHDKTILGTAAGKFAGADEQGPGIGKDSFSPAEGMLDQFCGGKLVMKCTGDLQSDAEHIPGGKCDRWGWHVRQAFVGSTKR